MASIRPSDLPAAETVTSDTAIIIDPGSTVQKATPLQIMDAARSLASQNEAELGTDNVKVMSALRVKQAIDAQALSRAVIESPEGAALVGVEGGGTVQEKFDTLASPDGAAGVGYARAGAGAVDETVSTILSRSVWAESYGLSESNTPAENAAAILAAVAAIRANGTPLSTDGLNGGAFTAYASGEILFGVGQFPVDSGVLRFTQDLGIILRGQGSRKTNNAVKGRTALVFSGVGEYGVQLYGNGARGFVCQDMDLLYSGGFAGDILDNFGAPGMELQRVHIGTEGISGATREATARSLIRLTYFEFAELLQVTLNGSVDGIWFDDTRNPDISTPPIEFGGAAVTFDRCVFYDCTGTMVRHDGNRNLKRLTIRECSFNPITTDCAYALNLNNVDALTVQGCMFTPSTTNVSTSGWVNIQNCTGSLERCEFLGNCKTGVIRGDFTFSNNVVVTTDGVEFTGGVIRSWGNEYTGTGYGVKLTGTTQLSAVIGPDRFGSTLTYSYDIPVDSLNFEVSIQYAPVWDTAVSRFRNVSGRVALRNVSRRAIPVTADTYNVQRTESGCIYRAEGALDQNFILPAIADVAGLEFTFVRNGSAALTITGPASSLAVGEGAAKTSMTFAAGDIGASVTLVNVAGAYNIISRVGTPTYA